MIELYSNNKDLQTLKNYTYIKEKDFNKRDQTKQIINNKNIYVFIIKEEETHFNELNNIYNIIKKNKASDFLILTNFKINNNEINKIFNKIQNLYKEKYNINITSKFQLLIEKLEILHRSYTIGKLIGFTSLHKINQIN